MDSNEALDKFGEVVEKVIDEPDKWPDSASFISFDVAIDKNILTPGKLRLIKYIKKNDVESLSSLADNLDRSLNNVSANLKELEEHNLVKVEKDGRKRIPKLKEDHVLILF